MRISAIQSKNRLVVSERIQIVVLLVVILLASFGLRVWELGDTALWADEVLTEYRAQAAFPDAVQSILKTIDQTPGYFFMLRMFPTETEFLLRLPSVLLGVLGTVMIMLIIVELYGDLRMALWGGVWLAFNPFHIWLSRTARFYSLIFVLATLISYLFIVLYRRQNNTRAWAAFTIVSGIAYVTHYSLLALPFTQMLFLLGTRSWRLSRRWFIAQVTAALPMLLWLTAMLLNFTSREPQWGEPPQVRDLGMTFWNLTVGYDGGVHWYSFVGLAIALVGLVQGIRRVESYWLLLGGVPLLLVFGVSVTVMDAYIDRYFMVVLPALVVLIAAGWNTLSIRLQEIALVVVVVITSLTVTDVLDSGQHERENWRGAAAYVDPLPGDVLVVDRAVTATVFNRYYSGETLPVIYLSETDQVWTMTASRYWVIYRNPSEDIHRLGTMPEFDPLTSHKCVVSDWLMPRLHWVKDYHEFAGVTVLLLEEQRYEMADNGF
ncbi:MAG: glycosyltransferase family 39 protein [Anaerolineae bacterium]|nr:glycosyltransferase family 39 protein [Anaerolineae bacterium]